MECLYLWNAWDLGNIPLVRCSEFLCSFTTNNSSHVDFLIKNISSYDQPCLQKFWISCFFYSASFKFTLFVCSSALFISIFWQITRDSLRILVHKGSSIEICFLVVWGRSHIGNLTLYIDGFQFSWFDYLFLLPSCTQIIGTLGIANPLLFRHFFFSFSFQVLLSYCSVLSVALCGNNSSAA